MKNELDCIDRFALIKSNTPLKDNIVESLSIRIKQLTYLQSNNIDHLPYKKYLIALVASIIISIGIGLALGEVAANKEEKYENSFAYSKYIGVEHYFYGVKKH